MDEREYPGRGGEVWAEGERGQWREMKKERP